MMCPLPLRVRFGLGVCMRMWGRIQHLFTMPGRKVLVRYTQPKKLTAITLSNVLGCRGLELLIVMRKVISPLASPLSPEQTPCWRRPR